MEILTIHRMRAATDFLVIGALLIRYAFLLSTGLILQIPVAAQLAQRGTVTDLTAPQAQGQQGLGVPGGSGGGTSVGSLAPANYLLPLRVEIIHASVGDSTDFILEARIENIGPTAFELPISRNISEVQRTTGHFRRQFYFSVRPASSGTAEPWIAAVTAGSSDVPHSLMRLAPRESARVLLRVESNWVRKAIGKDEKQIPVSVSCGEWTLDDSRFLIRATARDVISTNVAILGFSADQPVAKNPQP